MTHSPGASATAPAAGAPRVALSSLDTLWFQVGGTLCNLACSHCFVSCSPTNHTHEMMSLAEVEPYLDEGASLGVKEYYFTGGEPFLNPEMEDILCRALEYGPATVLTNGLLLDKARSQLGYEPVISRAIEPQTLAEKEQPAACPVGQQQRVLTRFPRLDGRLRR